MERGTRTVFRTPRPYSAPAGPRVRNQVTKTNSPVQSTGTHRPGRKAMDTLQGLPRPKLREELLRCFQLLLGGVSLPSFHLPIEDWIVARGGKRIQRNRSLNGTLHAYQPSGVATPLHGRTRCWTGCLLRPRRKLERRLTTAGPSSHPQVRCSGRKVSRESCSIQMLAPNGGWGISFDATAQYGSSVVYGKCGL